MSPRDDLNNILIAAYPFQSHDELSLRFESQMSASISKIAIVHHRIYPLPTYWKFENIELVKILCQALSFCDFFLLYKSLCLSYSKNKTTPVRVFGVTE